MGRIGNCACFLRIQAVMVPALQEEAARPTRMRRVIASRVIAAPLRPYLVDLSARDPQFLPRPFHLHVSPCAAISAVGLAVFMGSGRDFATSPREARCQPHGDFCWLSPSSLRFS